MHWDLLLTGFFRRAHRAQRRPEPLGSLVPHPSCPCPAREIDTAARAASRSTAMQADRCTSAKTLEQWEWEDATVFAKQELSRRLEEAEAQKQEHPAGGPSPGG
jgi:hypothetical protein